MAVQFAKRFAEIRGDASFVRAEKELGDLLQTGQLDTGTVVHSRRVAVMAAVLGAEVHLPHHVTLGSAIGGLTHDIGKKECLSIVMTSMQKGSFDDFAKHALRRHPHDGFVHTRSMWPRPTQPQRIAQLQTLGHHSVYADPSRNVPSDDMYHAYVSTKDLRPHEVDVIKHIAPYIAHADLFAVLLHPLERPYLAQSPDIPRTPDGEIDVAKLGVNAASKACQQLAAMQGMSAYQAIDAIEANSAMIECYALDV